MIRRERERGLFTFCALGSIFQYSLMSGAKDCRRSGARHATTLLVLSISDMWKQLVKQGLVFLSSSGHPCHHRTLYSCLLTSQAATRWEPLLVAWEMLSPPSLETPALLALMSFFVHYLRRMQHMMMAVLLYIYRACASIRV